MITQALQYLLVTRWVEKQQEKTHKAMSFEEFWSQEWVGKIIE